jgi:O-antigen ligase
VTTPCVFTTSLSDVFTLPKLIALWALLTTVSMLLVGGILTDEPGARLTWIGVVDAPLAAFVVLVLVAFAVSTDRRQSLFGEVLQHQGVLTTLLYVAFFYVTRALVRDVVRMRLLVVAAVIGATIVSAYAIVQKLGLDPIWDGHVPSGRVFSTIGQANALAAYLVTAIPMTAALALTSARTPRLAALAALGAMLGALVVTSSRGGILGLALAAGVMAYGVRDRIGRAWGATWAYLAAAIVAAAVLIAVAPVRSAITGLWSGAPRVSALRHDPSVDDHLDLWRVAIEIVERHPFVGTGPETFPDQFPSHSRAVLSRADVRHFEQFRIESPHNQLLTLAAGAGIPAAVAYVAVLVGLARTLWRRAGRSHDDAERVVIVAVVAAGAGHVATGSLMTAEVTGSWLFWVLMGGGVALAAMGSASRDAIPTPATHGDADGTGARDGGQARR